MYNKEYSKQYYIDNMEREKKRSEEYRKNNPKKIKQWNEDNSERKKQWAEDNPEKVKKSRENWLKNNPKYMKEWRERHPDEQKEWHKNNPERIRELYKRHTHNRRDLGFYPLNEYFEGSHAHHISQNFVIYIPEEIHKSIRHCLKTGKNMEAINKLAIEFLDK